MGRPLSKAETYALSVLISFAVVEGQTRPKIEIAESIFWNEDQEFFYAMVDAAEKCMTGRYGDEIIPASEAEQDKAIEATEEAVHQILLS